MTRWETRVVGDVRVVRYAWGVARRSRVMHAWTESGGTVCRAGGGEDINTDDPGDVPRCAECVAVIERGLRVTL